MIAIDADHSALFADHLGEHVTQLAPSRAEIENCLLCLCEGSRVAATVVALQNLLRNRRQQVACIFNRAAESFLPLLSRDGIATIDTLFDSRPRRGRALRHDFSRLHRSDQHSRLDESQCNATRSHLIVRRGTQMTDMQRRLNETTAFVGNGLRAVPLGGMVRATNNRRCRDDGPLSRQATFGLRASHDTNVLRVRSPHHVALGGLKYLLAFSTVRGSFSVMICRYCDAFRAYSGIESPSDTAAVPACSANRK